MMALCQNSQKEQTMEHEIGFKITREGLMAFARGYQRQADKLERKGRRTAACIMRHKARKLERAAQ